MDKELFSLRKLCDKDADRMLEWMHDDSITQYLKLDGKAATKLSVLKFISDAQKTEKNYHCAIVDEKDIYYGTVSLKNIDKIKGEAEYAIALHPSAIGQQVATVATKLIIELAFSELELGRVYLNVFDDNKRAIKFYDKFGFNCIKKDVVDFDGISKNLRWYEVLRDADFKKSIVPKKVVFFLETEKPFGGSQILFLDFAAYLADNMGYETYYINYSNPRVYELYRSSKMKILDIKSCNFEMLKDAIFFIPVNYLFYLLSHISDFLDAKICTYFYHPQVFTWLTNQMYVNKIDKESILKLLKEKDSASFMDKSNLVAANKLSSVQFMPEYVPITVHAFGDEYIEKRLPLINKDRINIGWLGRLDSDKIFSIVNLLDNLKASYFEKPIDIHLIGDGNAKWRLNLSQYAPKIRFIFTSYLYGQQRDEYIRQNIDLVVAMGISAVDCSLLGIPTVIPIVSPTQFCKDKYVYIFDIPEYSLGWNLDDLDLMQLKTYTIQEVVDNVYSSANSKSELANQGKVFCENVFSLDSGTNLLIEAINKTNLTVSDCLNCPPIGAQMRQFKLYKTLRPNSNFARYHMAISRLNGIVKKKGFDKIKQLCKELKKTLSINRNQVDKSKKFKRVYKNYPKKIIRIKAQWQKGYKIRVAFLVLFNGVFPFQSVFEAMMKDDVFDPRIIVIPNVTRSLDYRRTKYSEAYDGLAKKYGDLVLHGYNFTDDIFLELESDYSIVFFNNPYKNLVHKFHNIEYFLDKNVLTLYANYGFAALNFWNEVISTDFYNYLWKACVETSINFDYLKEHSNMKGSNALVTGYLKMDKLANYHPVPRKRKSILICPHHTVWGWKTLNISNFLQYADFFLELPKKYPDIDFVFRPHPLLFDNLLSHNIWNQKEIDDYLLQLTTNTNMIYDKSGDYFDTFANSDAMIHDCGSFIGEYLYTEKPCCYMLKSEEQIRETLLPLGELCLENYYHAFSKEDILKFIDDVIIDGKDYLSEQRKSFVNNILKVNFPNASYNLIEYIKNEIFK